MNTLNKGVPIGRRSPLHRGPSSTPIHRDGLLTEPGYHPDARLLYRPPAGFLLPAVPERPSPAEITAARDLLLDELLGDFPFTAEAERAHALALLLLGFVRPLIDGPTPLHMIEKPTPGNGATLMVDVIATILTSSGASVMTEGRDEDEWRKRLTAKLRQLPTLLLIDNLRQELDSSALAAALTAPAWEDRVLGASEMVRLPVRCAWVATGNNPAVSHEIARRLIRIRLDARTDQPWRSHGFRHPDLMVCPRHPSLAHRRTGRPRMTDAPLHALGQLSADSAVSGARSRILSSAFAGPAGSRLPCSQFRTVSNGTPIRAAKAACVSPVRRRTRRA